MRPLSCAEGAPPGLVPGGTTRLLLASTRSAGGQLVTGRAGTGSVCGQFVAGRVMAVLRPPSGAWSQRSVSPIASARSRAGLSARLLPLPLPWSGRGLWSVTQIVTSLPLMAAVSAGGASASSRLTRWTSMRSARRASLVGALLPAIRVWNRRGAQIHPEPSPCHDWIFASAAAGTSGVLPSMTRPKSYAGPGSPWRSVGSRRELGGAARLADADGLRGGSGLGGPGLGGAV